MLKSRYETPTRTVADPNWHKWITHEMLSDPAYVPVTGVYFDKIEKHKLIFVLTVLKFVQKRTGLYPLQLV